MAIKELFDFSNPIVCISWGVVAVTAITVIAKIISMAIKGEE